ncbi:MAG: hypothetical protein AAFN70_03895, partial [Planctomycetota bacterium]
MFSFQDFHPGHFTNAHQHQKRGPLGLRSAMLGIALMVTTCGMFSMAAPVRAQRGQLVEGLFRSLVEAQLEREQRKRLEEERRLRESPFGPVTPGVPPGGPPRIDRQRGPQAALIQGVSVSITENVTHINELVRQLQVAGRGNAGLRRYLPEAYHVQADFVALQQRCASANDPAVLLNAYRHLDEDWRKLSYRLRNVPQLPSGCTRCIQKLDACCDTLCERFDIRPQVDRARLRELMITVCAYIDTMIDDLEVTECELNLRRELSQEARRLQQVLRRHAMEIDSLSHDDCGARYGQFVKQWRTLSARLYPLHDHRLTRRLERIR